MLARLRIGTRIGLGFGALLTLITVMGGAGLWVAQTARSGIGTIDQIFNASSSLDEVKLAVSVYAVNPTPDQRKAALASTDALPAVVGRIIPGDIPLDAAMSGLKTELDKLIQADDAITADIGTISNGLAQLDAELGMLASQQAEAALQAEARAAAQDASARASEASLRLLERALQNTTLFQRDANRFAVTLEQSEHDKLEKSHSQMQESLADLLRNSAVALDEDDLTTMELSLIHI